MANGIVVAHKESGVRYAVSAHNHNPKVSTKVRDLKPGETVIGYQPKAPEDHTNTEGSSSEGTKAQKK